MSRFTRSFCLLLTLSLIAPSASADAAHPQPAGDDPLISPRTAWFRSAKIGMFIHWGLYSIAAGQWNAKSVDGTGEWILDKGHLSLPEYELLARDFNPTRFDAQAWVAVAKDARMKYLVVTSKHHDGFCMWPTKITPYNVIDSTPFGRDPLKELATACKAGGIKFGVYYSIMDWLHPELAGYWNAGSGAARDPGDPRVINYIEGQLKPQLRELIAAYDPALLWFDGEWQPWWDEQHGKDLEAFCRGLKPDLVINNRVGKRKPTDGDYETPEQFIPESAPTRRLWETCMTLNDTWGFKKNDHHWKSSSEVIARLGQIRSKGGNFLLNVGPDAAGQIPPESVIILHEIGQWLAANDQPPISPDRPTQKGAP